MKRANGHKHTEDFFETLIQETIEASLQPPEDPTIFESSNVVSLEDYFEKKRTPQAKVVPHAPPSTENSPRTLEWVWQPQSRCYRAVTAIGVLDCPDDYSIFSPHDFPQNRLVFEKLEDQGHWVDILSFITDTQTWGIAVEKNFGKVNFYFLEKNHYKWLENFKQESSQYHFKKTG